MKNYQDSDYAVNKYASGIVYRFADKTVEVTLDDYLRENPGKTDADFAALKALSDELYLEQVRGETAQGNKTAPLYALEETALTAAPSPEESVIDEPERAAEARRRRELATQALDKLTETQRRRYLLHTVEGLTMREIAEMESAHFTSVHESLLAAEKKIKKVLATAEKHPYKTGLKMH